MEAMASGVPVVAPRGPLPLSAETFEAEGCIFLLFINFFREIVCFGTFKTCQGRTTNEFVFIFEVLFIHHNFQGIVCACKLSQL